MNKLGYYKKAHANGTLTKQDQKDMNKILKELKEIRKMVQDSIDSIDNFHKIKEKEQEIEWLENIKRDFDKLTEEERFERLIVKK